MFIDNILVYSESEVEHEEYLWIVLQRLRDEKLSTKFFKCEFWLEPDFFLGHVVTKKGIMVDPAKVVVVHDWARPTLPTEIQSFVGLAGYYRRSVEGISSIAALLTNLT